MKKTLMAILLALSVSLVADAIPALRKPFAMRNSDGTTVMLYKHGDGRSLFYTSLDGKVVVPDEAGMFCYATLADGQLVASAVRVHDSELRNAEENAYVGSKALTPSDLAAARESSANQTPVRRIGPASTTDGLGKFGLSAKGAVPSLGEITIPVIMVQFADVKFQPSTTREYMTRFYNEKGFRETMSGSYTTVGSVRDYFVDQSYGQFKPTFDIVAVVTLSQGYAYYGANTNGRQDANVLKMLTEAVNLAKESGVDFNKYRSSKTNNIPNVSVLYAGQGEATSDDADAIWPHEMDLNTYYPIGGYIFGSYFVGNELYDKSIMGMGVFVHEFSHALGLPDLYDPTYSYQNDDSFGLWSVMDTGAYNDDTYRPVGYTAYEKSYMGWLDVREITNPEGVELTDPETCATGSAVMLRNPSAAYEYFILENRQEGTWTPFQGGSGLLVSRVRYSSSSWVNNTVNTNANSKRLCVVTADGTKINGNSKMSHLYGNGVANIEEFTLYNKTAYSESPVYQIIKHSDRTISFSVKERTLYAATADDGTRYSLVTDPSQLVANDTIIFVYPEEQMAMSLNTYSGMRSATNVKLLDQKACGNEDIQTFKLARTTDGKSFGFYAISSKKYLSVATGGTLTLASKADAKCMATISITDGLATVTFGGTYADNTLGFSTGDTMFKCYKPSEEKHVSIYVKRDLPTTDTPVESIKAELPHDGANRIYTLGGQYVGTSLQALPRGIYIKDGKKVVK